MEKYYSSIFNKKEAERAQKVICVKKVKQDVPEEWNESMPLPGDIIEGFAKDAADDSFKPIKSRSEFSAQLKKISRENETIWLKVRRGDSRVKLRVHLVQEWSSTLRKKIRVKAASDERHVVVLDDLTFEECSELQEMSRSVVNVRFLGYNQIGMKYDWRMKVCKYLPDARSTVISSILFMPLAKEHSVEATTVRTMAWFSAAVSSGIPLIFVNIQTEKITPLMQINNSTRKDNSGSRQLDSNIRVQTQHGVRLWFLPGVAEIPLELTPEPVEARFGLDIRQTEEGFICVWSVAEGTAADRSGLGNLFEQAKTTGHLVVISQLEGKSLMPSTVSSDGLIYCCDRADIRETLASAMGSMDTIELHIMSWPNQMVPHSPQELNAATLRPPRR